MTKEEKSQKNRGPLGGLQMHIPINRYALLSLYLVVILLRGCTYWGWSGIQEMLYKSEAYLWECNDPSVTTPLKIGNISFPDCPERKEKIGAIFTTALGSNLLSSFFAGVALDTLGPKITLLFGVVMDVVGWTLLGVSGHSFQAYYAAAFCIGVGSDPGYLPLISISKLFPKNSSFVISIMGSLRSVSFAVPVIMSAIFRSDSFGKDELWKMCIGYAGVGEGITLLVCLLFVPMRAFQVAAGGNAAAERDAAAAADDADDAAAAKEDSVSTAAAAREDTRPFWKLILDSKFLLLVPIFCCALVRSDYYAKSNKEQLLEISSGRDLQQMFAIFNILSFLPGPMFGRIADAYGIIVVLLTLNTSGVLMFIFLMFDSLACKGISIVFFFVYTSFVLSNVYCFISIYFPAHAFGKLAGLTSAFGGVFVLLSIAWYGKVLEFEYPNNFRVVDGIMVGIGLLVYALIFVLWRITKKETKNNKVLDSQKTTAEPAEPESTVSVSV